jgi:hypothetical protein
MNRMAASMSIQRKTDWLNDYPSPQLRPGYSLESDFAGVCESRMRGPHFAQVQLAVLGSFFINQGPLAPSNVHPVAIARGLACEAAMVAPHEVLHAGPGFDGESRTPEIGRDRGRVAECGIYENRMLGGRGIAFGS